MQLNEHSFTSIIVFQELEEALLTDGTEESASSLLTELIVRLLNGCLGNNDISAFNYQVDHHHLVCSFVYT